MTEQTAVAAHYERRNLRGLIVDALRSAGLDPARLGPDDLAPLEEFHTLGRRATLELAELAAIQPGMRVLDVGAGLGGPARLLARRFRCRVTALDLTEAYCDASRLLNELAGVDTVEVRRGDALDLPFADGLFDVVWTQHTTMNIADKAAFYAEVARVLRHGGRFAFFDVVAGALSPIHFPVPWATEPSISFLASIDETAALVAEAGLRPVVWEDLTEPVLAFFAQRDAASGGAAPPTIGTHLLAQDMPKKVANQARNAREGRVRFLRGVLER